MVKFVKYLITWCCCCFLGTATCGAPTPT